MDKKTYLIFSVFVVILIYSIFSCGKKSNNKNSNAVNQHEIADITLFIKWPENLDNKNLRALKKIPLATQSIKIIVTGTNITTPIELIINKDPNADNKSIDSKIPVGFTYFKVIGYTEQNCLGKQIAYGEIQYNILPAIVNKIKITLASLPQSISIEPKDIKIKLAETYLFIANVLDIDGFILPVEKINWKIEDKIILEIDSNGLIKGLNEGSTYVIAEYKELNTKAYVEVVNLIPPKNLSIKPGNKQIRLNWSFNSNSLSYLIYYSDSSNISINNKNFLTITNDTTFIHTDLKNGKTYYYIVAAKNGELTSPSSVISSTPTDTFLYALCADSSLIEEFAINNNTGELIKIDKILSAGIKSEYKIDKNIACSLNKKTLYVASYESDKIYQYSINEITGELSYLDEINSGDQPREIKISPSGEFIYVTNYNEDSISCYNILEDGKLSWTENIYASSGPNAICINPLNNYLYVGCYKSPYYTYQFELKNLKEIPTKFVGTKNITSMLFSTYGKTIYTTSYDLNTIDVYSADKVNGKLSYLNSYQAGYRPNSLIITPLGNSLYSTSYGSDSIISYNLDTTTGDLTSNEIVKCGDGPQDIVVTSNGNFLYVANSLEDSISIYKIDSTKKLVFTNKISTNKTPIGLYIFSKPENVEIQIGIE